MPKAGVILWKKLREANRQGYNFRRQHPVGAYVADFASLDAAPIVELDGASHDVPEAQEHDARRTEFLRSHDYTVLRFRNSDVYGDLYGVVNAILRHVPPPSRRR